MIKKLGGRKMALGIMYLVFSFGLMGLTVFLYGDPALVGTVAGGCLSISSGLLVVVWGNVREHETNGKS